jgi:Spy/CpxP family protein refolding chaperone
MNNKYWVWCVGAGLAVGLWTAAPAQAANKPADAAARPKAVQKLSELGVELDLTADQKAKVKTLLQEQKEKLKEIRQDASLSKVDKAAKLREAQQDFAKKLKEILTPEQYAKWEKARDEAQAERKANRQKQR